MTSQPAPSASSDDAENSSQKPGPTSDKATSLVEPDPTPPAATESEAVFGVRGKPLNQRTPFFMGFTGALGAFLAWAVYQAVIDLWSILLLVLVSAFLAIGLNPAVVWLQKLRIPRIGAVAIVGLGALGFLVGAVFAIGPPIVEQGGHLIEKAPDYIENLKKNEFLRDLNTRFDLIDRLKEAASGDIAAQAAGGVLGGLGFLASALFNIVTGFVLTLYFLAAFDRLKTGAYKLVPASRRERAQLLGDEMLKRVGRYVSGALAIAFIAGASSLAFMMLTDIPYPWALALVVALTDLIPQIGATIGAVFVVIVAFFVSVPVAIAAIIFFIGYQQLENFVIYPQVMKRAVKVSDLAAIISALMGAALLGVVGALLAIPVCAAVQLLVREVLIPRQEAK